MTTDGAASGTVAILGAGVMGETLLSGLLRAGRRPDDVVVAERRPDRAAEIAARHGVRVLGNAEAASLADTVVLVVKPQDVEGVLAEIRDAVTPGTLVVSIAAGIPTAFVEQRLAGGVAVVRAMPNTPALVGEGMTAISPGACCLPEHTGRAEALLAAMGAVLRVPEYQQDAVTAVSGSGPAYVFYVAEAMIEAGCCSGSRGRRRPNSPSRRSSGPPGCSRRPAPTRRCFVNRSAARGARRWPLSGSSTTTGCGPRSSPRSRPRGTVPRSCPRLLSRSSAVPRGCGRSGTRPAGRGPSRGPPARSCRRTSRARGGTGRPRAGEA